MDEGWSIAFLFSYGSLSVAFWKQYPAWLGCRPLHIVGCGVVRTPMGPLGSTELTGIFRGLTLKFTLVLLYENFENLFLYDGSLRMRFSSVFATPFATLVQLPGHCAPRTPLRISAVQQWHSVLG